MATRMPHLGTVNSMAPWPDGLMGHKNVVKIGFRAILLPSASPPRRESTPSTTQPKWGRNFMNTTENMLYISWMVILGDHNITKKSFRNFDF